MSTVSKTTVPNPLNNFSALQKSTEPIAIKVTNNFSNIYKNYLLFDAENDNNGNINNLDNASFQIQTSFLDIIRLIKPCATSTESNKCRTTVCAYVSDIEKLIVQYFIILTDITSEGVKINYQFLPFLLLKSISDIITDNKLNYDPGSQAYILCSTGTTYTPQSDNPELEKQYKTLLSKMGDQMSSRDTRQFNFGLIQFLVYILLPTVIFIILILLYVRHVQNSKLIEAAAKATLANNAASSDSIPIIVPQTTEEQPVIDNKLGGSMSDLLGFLSYLRFF
jgi:hypothetical protein